MARECNRCGMSFYPTGKNGRVCETCKAKAHSVRIAHFNFKIGLDRIFLKLGQEAPLEA